MIFRMVLTVSDSWLAWLTSRPDAVAPHYCRSAARTTNARTISKPDAI
jgi:hypothetical protein